MSGYVGKLLNVDLTTGKWWTEETNKYAEKFFGGSGIAASIIFNETDFDIDPLGPDNILCFVSGPATGTDVICAGRHQIAAKSPATGTYGEASSGGHWGVLMKRAGYDGIIFRGAATEPVYLWVKDGDVEIRSAEKLWGADTFQTQEQIIAETHPKTLVTCIGPAGEKMSKLAAVMSEGKAARAAARGGLGAVMGSKKLKGIAVYGEGKIPVHDNQCIREVNKEITPNIVESTAALKKYGTGAGVQRIEAVGDLPIRNWSQGSWKEGADKVNAIVMSEQMQLKTNPCYRCIIGCSKDIVDHEGPYGKVDGRGPEYESLASLGAYPMVDDLEAVVYANELCNKYGIDTISVGGVIAFAVELFEEGIITEEDTGRKLAWGDPDTLLHLVHQIGKNEGFGAILGEGSRKAAEIIGRGADKYAMQIKGLELPAHDPRARTSLALAYATSNRGACHLQGQSSIYESFATDPALGIEKPLDPFTSEGKADLVIKSQAYGSMFDSICMCRYFRPGTDKVVRYISCVLGKEMTVEDFLLTGSRIFTLKRLYNLCSGLTNKDDMIPERIATLAFPDSGSKGNLPDLPTMLQEYYELQNWSSDGIPTLQRLRELGLEDVIPRIPANLRRE